MNDKLFPDEGNEYEYNEEDDEGEELLEKLVNFWRNILNSSKKGEKEHSENRIDGNGLGGTEEELDLELGIEKEENDEEKSFSEKAGALTYLIIFTEIFLVSYLILALLGYLPMF